MFLGVQRAPSLFLRTTIHESLPLIRAHPLTCGVWLMAQASFLISQFSGFFTMAEFDDGPAHFNTPDLVKRGACCHADCTKNLTSHNKKTLAGPILFDRRYNSTGACMNHCKLHLQLTKVLTNLDAGCGGLFQNFLFHAHCVAGDTRQLWIPNLFLEHN